MRITLGVFILLAVAMSTTPALGTAHKIVAGRYFTIALENDGTLRAWGDNYYGQLGDGTTTRRLSPVQVTGLAGVAAVAGGGYHTVALKNDGTVWTWGDNSFGQLGDGTTMERHAPAQVKGLAGITAIAAGYSHTVALISDGSVWTWGDNSYGQLGDGTIAERNNPVQVTGLAGVMAVAAGDVHTVAIKGDGTVWAWGDNYYGQLGDGTTMESHTPVQVKNFAGATAIEGGAYHTVALKNDGTVWAWGDNSYGQLGDGTIAESYVPVSAKGPAGVIAVVAGRIHTVALKSDGTVWTWGDNSFGQLGDGGTTAENHAPAPVAGLAGMIAVAAGDEHTVALRNDGAIWAWGNNANGQLGDGTNTRRLFPVQVKVPLTTILTGTGGGSVHSNPSGLACSSGTCTVTIPLGTSVTLMATPDADSIFAGWTGGGCTGLTDCTMTITATTMVSAGFDYVEPAKVQGGNSYPTLSGAYAGAQDDDTILARTFGFKEDLVLGRNIACTLRGGFDTSFANNPGITTLEGILTVIHGVVTVENLAVK